MEYQSSRVVKGERLSGDDESQETADMVNEPHTTGVGGLGD